MYIEDRLFSESTEEVLYSVALDEEEYALYSEFQERTFGAKKYKRMLESIIKKEAAGKPVSDKFLDSTLQRGAKVYRSFDKRGLERVLQNKNGEKLNREFNNLGNKISQGTTDRMVQRLHQSGIL